MSGLEFRTPFSCLLGTNPFDGLSKMLMKIYRFQDPRNAKSFLGFHRKTKNFAIRLNSLRNWRQPRERSRGQSRERGCRTLICRQGNRCKRQGNRRFQWKSFERCGRVERSRENGVGRNVWCGRFYRGIHGGQLVWEVVTEVLCNFPQSSPLRITACAKCIGFVFRGRLGCSWD